MESLDPPVAIKKSRKRKGEKEKAGGEEKVLNKNQYYKLTAHQRMKSHLVPLRFYATEEMNGIWTNDPKTPHE